MSKLVAFLLSIPLVVGMYAIAAALTWGLLTIWERREQLSNYRASLKEAAGFLFLLLTALLVLLGTSARVSELLVNL